MNLPAIIEDRQRLEDYLLALNRLQIANENIIAHSETATDQLAQHAFKYGGIIIREKKRLQKLIDEVINTISMVEAEFNNRTHDSSDSTETAPAATVPQTGGKRAPRETDVSQ